MTCSSPLERGTAHCGADSYLIVVYGPVVGGTTEPAFKMFQGLLFMNVRSDLSVSKSF